MAETIISLFEYVVRRPQKVNLGKALESLGSNLKTKNNFKQLISTKKIV